MDKATDYITSQRKDIYHTQEEVERKINGVNDMLDQYINGETELDPSQLMELNTTKAQLEALQTNLSVAAKGLKNSPAVPRSVPRCHWHNAASYQPQPEKLLSAHVHRPRHPNAH